MSEHDPLCGDMFDSELGIPLCICELLRGARADERERAAERVEALPVRQLDYWEVVARGHVLAAIRTP